MALVQVSETKSFVIRCDCSNQEIRIMWLNYLGGFDQWVFTANKDKNIEIRETGEVRKDIFNGWTASYGQFADTVRKQVFRDSNYSFTVRSQNIKREELEAIAFIKTSPLVQIVKSRMDRRTVLIDTDSFRIYTDRDDLYSISFVAAFTDDIPSQTS